MNSMTRTAQTSNGKTVPLNECRPIEGGFVSWVLNRRGHAVQVFVPVS
jgi:hypothetical protein